LFTGQNLNLQKYNIVIVPFAYVDSLGEDDYNAIVNFARDGGNVILDTKTELAGRLDLKFSRNRISINKIRTNTTLRNRSRGATPNSLIKCSSMKRRIVLFRRIDTAAFGGWKIYRQGEVALYRITFRSLLSAGYSLYPYLLEYVKRFFKLRPVVRRDNLEVYFDPGFRRTISVENSIKQWVYEGIKIIHVAGWHQYPKYSYDYKHLI